MVRGHEVACDSQHQQSALGAARRSKINSSDPPLTAVRTAYPTQPFLPFSCTHQSSWPAFAENGYFYIVGRIKDTLSVGIDADDRAARPLRVPIGAEDPST